jgi:hypothetical protein
MAIDWKNAEDTLVQKSTVLIEEFAHAHPDLRVSFFAFGADYFYGDIAVAFDTPDNTYSQAVSWTEQVIEARITLSAPNGWEYARYTLTKNRILEYPPSSGLFKYESYSVISFPEWEDYFGSDEIPGHPDPQGHVLVLLWRVLERLVERQAFNCLRQASPFRIGFDLADDDLGLVVVRMFNWTGPPS